jgi:hypothetical protein
MCREAGEARVRKNPTRRSFLLLKMARPADFLNILIIIIIPSLENWSLTKQAKCVMIQVIRRCGGGRQKAL